MQDLDTEIVVETATGTTTRATAVSANLVIDERQMNAVFLDVVSCIIIKSSIQIAAILACLAAIILVLVGAMSVLANEYHMGITNYRLPTG